MNGTQAPSLAMSALARTSPFQLRPKFPRKHQIAQRFARYALIASGGACGPT